MKNPVKGIDFVLEWWGRQNWEPHCVYFYLLSSKDIDMYWLMFTGQYLSMNFYDDQHTNTYEYRNKNHIVHVTAIGVRVLHLETYYPQHLFFPICALTPKIKKRISALFPLNI